jgi:hypothetical protein
MIIRRVREEVLTQLIVSRFEELKQNRGVKEDIWLECVDAYMGRLSDEWYDRAKSERRSARFVGMSFDAAESNHSVLMSMMMSGENWLNIEPAMPGRLEYDDEGADQLKSLLQQQMYQINFKRDMALLIKQLCIVGNAPYTVGWKREYAVNYPEYERAMAEWQVVHAEAWERYRSEMSRWEQAARSAQEQGLPVPPAPSLVAPEPPPGNPDLAYSGPSFEVGSIFDFLIDPYSPDPARPLMFKRSWISDSALRRLGTRNRFGYSVYEDVEDVPPMERRTGKDSDKEVSIMSTFGIEAPPGDAHEIIECWGTIEAPGDGGVGKKPYVNFVGAVINRQRLVRFEPSYLWSGKAAVGMAKYRDVPGQVYGIGPLEPVLGLQDLINARTNQLIDIVSYSINPEYKAYDDSRLASEFVSAPNKIHWVQDMDNLQVIQKDLRGLNVAMGDVELLKQEFMRMVKSASPASGPSDESATKTRQQGAAVGNDLAKIAAYIEETGLAPIMDLFIELNAQYLPKATAVRMIESGQPVFKEVSPETIRKGYLARVKGTSFALDKQERLDKLLMFLQMVIGSPLATSAVDLLALYKKVYEELGFGDVGEIFHDEARANEILGEMLRSGLLGNNPGFDAEV